MGHVVDFITVEKEKDIMKAALEFAYYNVDREENHSGSYHGNLTIHHIGPLEDKDKAIKAIQQYDTGWYSDHAVPYYETIGEISSKKLDNIIKRINETYDKKKEFQVKSWVGNRKSKFIGCENCGSKINRTYIRENNNNCSICHSDLRPNSTLDRLKQYDVKINDLQKEKKKIEKELAKKLKRKAVWLVKVEVHC